MFSRATYFLFFNLLIIIVIAAVGLNPQSFVKQPIAGELASFNGQQLEFVGRVCEESEANFKNRQIVVCAKGRILLTTNLYPEYNYGDFIKIKGLVQAPPELSDFDYGRYLRRYNIYSVMYYPQIAKVSGNLTISQKTYLFLLKGKWRVKTMIERSLHEPEAGLGEALLLGYRRTIFESDSLAFSRTGLSHLIAISGSHITIMSAMLVNLLLFLGASRKLSGRGVFLFLFLYPLITGLSASAIRSAVMGGLVFIGYYQGRLIGIFNALIFAAGVMLIFNPRLLRDDIGFQLSFAAILGVAYLYPLGGKVSQYLKTKLKNRIARLLIIFWEIFSLTLACQIAVLPIMLINFKQVSIISLIANPVIAWIFPLLLASLIIPIFPTLFLPGLGVSFFLPAHLLLSFLFTIARLFSSFSWAAVEIKNFDPWLAFIYYLFFTIFVLIIKYRERMQDTKGNRLLR